MCVAKHDGFEIVRCEQRRLRLALDKVDVYEVPLVPWSLVDITLQPNSLLTGLECESIPNPSIARYS